MLFEILWFLIGMLGYVIGWYATYKYHLEMTKGSMYSKPPKCVFTVSDFFLMLGCGILGVMAFLGGVVLVMVSLLTIYGPQIDKFLNIELFNCGEKDE